MSTAVFPGTFDPVTLGHLDMIERAAGIFDRLIVGVLNNNSKIPLFSVQERVSMLRDVTGHIANVEVRSFGGLLVDFVLEVNADVIVRGLRGTADLEYELQMAHTNRRLSPRTDTFFLPAKPEYSYVSSSMVREAAMFGADVRPFVPDAIIPWLEERVAGVPAGRSAQAAEKPEDESIIKGEENR